MPTFYVLAVSGLDSSNLKGATVKIKWTSGLGADLGEDTYFTDDLGRALIATPKVFIIPDGASGRITVTQGSLIGEDVASVNAFGGCDDHIIQCYKNSAAVVGTTISGITDKAGNALKTSAWFIIGILIAAGVVLWGAKGLIKV